MTDTQQEKERNIAENRGDSVRALLLFEMQHGAFRHAYRLPRENELAERLSISRTQLRDSLAQLEREGFITRRHGVGTQINRHVLDVRVRADIEVEFSDMIRSSGCEPKVKLVEVRHEIADEHVAQRLSVQPGVEVVVAARIAYASERPAIYCEDCLAASIIRVKEYGDSALEPPIFDFLRRYCGVEAYMDITELRPAVADKRLAGLLETAVGAPLLYMDEVDYDIDGVPVLYARQYYVDGIIKHTLMRKKF